MLPCDIFVSSRPTRPDGRPGGGDMTAESREIESDSVPRVPVRSCAARRVAAQRYGTVTCREPNSLNRISVSRQLPSGPDSRRVGPSEPYFASPRVYLYCVVYRKRSGPFVASCRRCICASLSVRFLARRHRRAPPAAAHHSPVHTLRSGTVPPVRRGQQKISIFSDPIRAPRHVIATRRPRTPTAPRPRGFATQRTTDSRHAVH